MAPSDIEKQQLREQYESSPPIIYHISNSSLSHQKPSASRSKKSAYKNFIRCQPIWVSILFLSFLVLTMILAVLSMSKSQILDLRIYSYEKLRQVGQEISLKYLPCESSESGQAEDLPEGSLFQSSMVGKHLISMVRRASSNSTGVPADLSTASKHLPSTIDPSTVQSSSQIMTSHTSFTSTPTGSHKSSSSSSVATGHAKSSSSATATEHSKSSGSSATATEHSKSSGSSATATDHSTSSVSSSHSDSVIQPTITYGVSSSDSHISPTTSMSGGIQTETSSLSSSKSEGIYPPNSITDGVSPSATNRVSSGTGDIHPSSSVTDGTPRSGETKSPKSGGHEGSAGDSNHGENDSENNSDDPTHAGSKDHPSPRSSMTHKIYYTTTMADGAVSTQTSTTIIMANSEPTGSSGGTRQKGSNGLQTSAASQTNIFSWQQLLGVIGMTVVALT